MIGMSGQSWAALAMVAVAAVYLARLAWRTLRGVSSGPGCCGSGCPSAHPDASEAQPKGESGTFVPLENLADLARRHKRENGP
jgi:hypothetical protein